MLIKPRVKTVHFRSVLVLMTGWVIAMGACSSVTVKAPGPLPEEPPPLVVVPHPAGFDMGDVRAIFNEKGAPPPESFKDCDADFRKLMSLTQSRVELGQGAREFVQHDPVKYHWCFYTKILELENGLQKDSYLDERQKRVLETYDFLVPIAHGFQAEFHDSRYLRWAIQRYRRLSEWVFFRRVELSPQATVELSAIENPFALWRQPNDDQKPVLEKYGLSAPPEAPSAKDRAPAAAPGGKPEIPEIKDPDNFSATEEEAPVPPDASAPVDKPDGK